MTAFQLTIRRLLADESAASMVEEALIVALMVVAVMVGISALTNTLKGGIFGVAEAIEEVRPAS